MTSYNLPAPRSIIASNLPLPSHFAGNEHAEPGVEVRTETLATEPILNGALVRARVATSKQVPTSNDGHGNIPLDDIPGLGVVLPGGLNLYYLDIAPNSEGTMHRTTSTDYLVVISGNLSLMTPGPEAYEIKNGKGTYVNAVETICSSGDIVSQRGMMHALSNNTSEWVRVIGIVLSSETNKVPIGDTNKHKELSDQWLA